jgi:endonuclease/exonuclease/phosphatase family metal-dependent hydrolase
MKNVFAALIFLFIMTGTQAQEVTTMTYNIRMNTDADGENAWPLRKEYLASQIKFYNPDFFGVQEALPEQMGFLREQFSAYTALGEGREGKNKGEFSALFYNTGKFNLEENGMFWLSKTPEKVSTGWDAALPRVCTYGLFRLKEGGKKIWVFNTHFDHIGQKARVNSAQLILDKIKDLNTENYPVVVMGDLNVEPDNEVITTFKKEMSDAHEISQEPAFGPKGTFNGFHFDEPVTRRIDYIFVSKNGLEVMKYAILSDSKDLKYPSDHLPVYTLLKLK